MNEPLNECDAAQDLFRSVVSYCMARVKQTVTQSDFDDEEEDSEDPSYQPPRHISGKNVERKSGRLEKVG